MFFSTDILIQVVEHFGTEYKPIGYSGEYIHESNDKSTYMYYRPIMDPNTGDLFLRLTFGERTANSSNGIVYNTARGNISVSSIDGSFGLEVHNIRGLHQYGFETAEINLIKTIMYLTNDLDVL